MPFAEPRPNRNPFSLTWHILTDDLYFVSGIRTWQLALTSLTIANEDVKSSPVGLYSGLYNATSEEMYDKDLLLRMFVPAQTTLHLPFPHPLMFIEEGCILVEPINDTGLPGSPIPLRMFVTAVGYGWAPADDPLPGEMSAKSKLSEPRVKLMQLRIGSTNINTKVKRK